MQYAHHYFDVLVANKDWVFSGIGVFVITALIGLLRAVFGFNKLKKGEGRPLEQPMSAEQLGKAPQTAPKNRSTEVDGVADRFKQVLTMMNAAHRGREFTIASLAREMSLESIGNLESVFNGEREPSFEFIDRFCRTFCVNEGWLVEGKGQPYWNDERALTDPYDYLPELQKADPGAIYFIRSNSETGQAFILLKFSDFKYKILPRYWHISDDVGTGGQRQLLSFYHLIQAVREKGLYHKCFGRSLTHDVFMKLLDGEVFPGSVLIKTFENPWWDDFTDIYHKYPVAERYESLYGKSFMDAQWIVRWMIEETNKRVS